MQDIKKKPNMNILFCFKQKKHNIKKKGTQYEYIKKNTQYTQYEQKSKIGKPMGA